jgi:uncharacterized protein (DUF983 family)
MEPARSESTTGRAIMLFSRALLLRCPICGHGGIFQSWFKLKDQCPTCKWVYARGESGYQLGSMLLDLVIPLIVWFFGFFGILIATWPTPPWTLLQWGSVAFIIGAPLLLYPFSHTLAIALDILVRPADHPK